MTTGKTIALNIQTFISKVMALPFNMLSRFVIVFFQFNLFSSFSSVTLSCMILWTVWPAACQASLFITNSWSYSNSCPLSQWCHPTISPSVIPFSFCLQPCPASGSFLMSWLFTLGGQSIGSSASASVLPMNIQDWFPVGLTGLSSLLSNGLSRVFSSTTVRMYQFFRPQASLESN